MSAHTPEDRAVMLHLVRLIQDSPDVRYFVGGAHTQMRTLLVAAIKAAGVRVLIEPKHASHNDEGRAVAGRIADGEHEASLQRERIADLDAEGMALFRRVRANVARAEGNARSPWQGVEP